MKTGYLIFFVGSRYISKLYCAALRPNAIVYQWVKRDLAPRPRTVMTEDYADKNVSVKVIEIIESHAGFVRQPTWAFNGKMVFGTVKNGIG